MVEAAGPRISQWYVAFRDVKKTRWWQKFLKPGFRHSFAFTYDAACNRWLFLDPGWDGISLLGMHPLDFHKKLVKIYRTHTILLCDTGKDVIFFPRLVMTCTTEIAHLLGFSTMAWTPWRLFCALRKRGAKISFVAE